MASGKASLDGDRLTLTVLLVIWLATIASSTSMAAPKPASASKVAKKQLQATRAAAREAFDGIFGERLKVVVATRDAADDLALAKEMLELARKSKGTPGVFILLCEHTYKLTSKNPKGLEIASHALQLLLDHFPEQKPDWLAAMVDVRQSQFAGTLKKKDKAEAGEALILALVMLGDLHLDQGKINDAMIAYRRAMSVARSIRFDRFEEIKAKLNAATTRQRLVRRAEQLAARLAANPKDEALARQLVQIYLVEMDNPVAAAEYALLLDDATLLENISRMTQEADSPSEDDSKSLGQWYKELAATAGTDQTRFAMMVRAIFFHQEFLVKHGADDLAGKAIAVSLEILETELAKLEAKLEKAGIKMVSKYGLRNKGGRVIDLMRLIDTAKHTVSGTWQRKGPTLELTERSKHAKIRFPVIPQGSYELTIEFTRIAGDWSIGPILPVGEKGVSLQMSNNTAGEYSSGLHKIQDKNATSNSTTRNGALVTGKRYLLSIRVMLINDKDAKITVDMDGKPYLAWQGPMSDLSQQPSFALTEPISLGFTAYDTQMKLHVIKLKMLSGKAIGLPNK